MKIKPIGFSVLVKPDPVEEVSKGGIILNTDQRDEAVIIKGTLIAKGKGAWSDKPEDSYPDVGDKVIYAKYAGTEIKDPDDGEKYRLIIDEDIKAIVGE